MQYAYLLHPVKEQTLKKNKYSDSDTEHFFDLYQ